MRDHFCCWALKHQLAFLKRLPTLQDWKRGRDWSTRCPRRWEEWKAYISLQLGLLVWQVIGPVCLDLKKVARHGAGGSKPASSYRNQAAGRDGGWKPARMVPVAGAWLAATALPGDLGDTAPLSVPQFLFWVNHQCLKLSWIPVATSTLSEAAIYLFISICMMRLHLDVYPGAL